MQRDAPPQEIPQSEAARYFLPGEATGAPTNHLLAMGFALWMRKHYSPVNENVH